MSTGASICTELKSESISTYIWQCMHAWNVIIQRFIATIIIIMYDISLHRHYTPHTHTNNIVDPNRHENLTVYIDEKLGSGVFGEVFKGSYRGEICAVKVLHQVAMKMNLLMHISEEASKAFDIECTFLKSLLHPNVVQYLSTTNHPQSGGAFLVVELMDWSLGSYLSSLDKESLTSESQISLSKDIACGLAYNLSSVASGYPSLGLEFDSGLIGCVFPRGDYGADYLQAGND